MHIAKSEDMSTKNYNKIRAAEEGEELNWATIYLECLQKRVAIVIERGGSTVVYTLFKVTQERRVLE